MRIGLKFKRLLKIRTSTFCNVHAWDKQCNPSLRKVYTWYGKVDDTSCLLCLQVGDEAVLEGGGLGVDTNRVRAMRQSQHHAPLSVVLRKTVIMK